MTAPVCATSGCGSTDDLDASDPALWGWIRVQVAGAESGARWVCSAMCAGAVLAEGAAELADADHRAADATEGAR